MSKKEKVVTVIVAIVLFIIFSPLLIATYKMWYHSLLESLKWNGTPLL